MKNYETDQRRQATTQAMTSRRSVLPATRICTSCHTKNNLHGSEEFNLVVLFSLKKVEHSYGFRLSLSFQSHFQSKREIFNSFESPIDCRKIIF